ncbi:MAG: response regulator transcription factor [Terracidiphilus sp.]
MEDVLLIDDDVELCAMLTDYLSRNGFRVKATHRGDTGLVMAQQRQWAVVLLDVMLPGMDGFEVLKRIRSESNVNVLLLTARGEDVDRIVGLEIGADDYLPKPFNPRELLARMRAVLRRQDRGSAPPPGQLRVQDLALDVASRKASRAGQKLELTDVEFGLLEALMRVPGKVLSRDELSQAVLGRAFDPFDRSLDMHVSRLRRKLGRDGEDEDRVKTIRGVGYQLVLDRDFNGRGD